VTSDLNKPLPSFSLPVANLANRAKANWN